MWTWIIALTLLTTVSAEEEISECLKNCILPLAKFERSYSFVFNNYESACETLEAGAYCVQKCPREDQNKYHQYSTFYRIHCIDYEELLEPHLPCLKVAAKDIDSVCRDRCRDIGKVEKTAAKETKEKQSCLYLECSTVCYFQEFAEDCPNAKEALLKVNVGQIHSIANTIHPLSFERMQQECRNVHDIRYMEKKMLDE